MSSVLHEISQHGTSIWLDDLSRERLISGGSSRALSELISQDSVVGVTTNPAIFSSAISNSPLYRGDIATLAQRGLSVEEIITDLTCADVTAACDLFTETHQRSRGVDGRVSIEVDPRFARNTEATISQARELWQRINRANLLIKVPATMEGLPAIRQLISEGISVNVTIIFSVSRYRQVLDSYISGLEDRLARGLPVSDIHSVASFFVSRVDTEIDSRLRSGGHASSNSSKSLEGRAALANARLAYQHFQEISSSTRWRKLFELGALPQRPLWASTGVKDPAYAPGMYVTELIAPETVNTMPEATLVAVKESGSKIRESITEHFNSSHQTIAELAGIGIDIEEVALKLENEGIEKFTKPWLQLIDTVAKASNS